MRPPPLPFVLIGHAASFTRTNRTRRVLDPVLIGQVELYRRDYFANGGWETFLSYEDPVQVPPLPSKARRCGHRTALGAVLCGGCR